MPPMALPVPQGVQQGPSRPCLLMLSKLENMAPAVQDFVS